MNKTVYLGLSIIEVSKTVMYEFFYDHVKPKNEKKWNSVSFIVYIKTDYIYKDIAEDVKTRLEFSNYETTTKRTEKES